MKRLMVPTLMLASFLAAAGMIGTALSPRPATRLPNDLAELGRGPNRPQPFYDSLNCRFVGNWPFGVCFAVSGDTLRHHAYLGSGGGVFVVDVTDPAAPRRISDRLHTQGEVRGLIWDPAGHLLYIADGYSGVEIWDMTNDTLPSFVARVSTTNNASRMALNSHFLYVADGTHLRVVDVADPHSPHDTGSVTLRRQPMALAAAGSWAYVVSYDTGLCVINVAQPGNPTIAAYCEYPGHSYAVTLNGTHALVGCDTALQVIDIQTPTNPQFAGGTSVEPGPAWGVFCADTVAVVADGYGGLRTYNIANIAVPHQMDTVPIAAGDCYGLVGFGHYAGVVQDWGGLVTVDFTPGNAHRVGQSDAPGSVRDVTVSGAHAYLAGSNYLSVIDLANPLLPLEVSRCSVGCGTIALVRGYLYAIPGGIIVYDISTPGSPHNVGSLYLSSAIEAFASDSFHACAATYDSGSYVLDVSNPTSPVAVGHCHTPHGVSRVALNGRFAYVNHQDSGLYVISLADPAHPFVASRCSVGYGGYGYAVAAAGHYVYAGSEDLTIVDVQDSARPRIVGTLPSIGPAWSARAVGSKVYLAADYGGLKVCDVSDTASPRLVAWHSGPDMADGITVVGTRAYLAESFSGLDIYDYVPGGVAESGSSPAYRLAARLASNPTGDRAVVLLDLPASSRVGVDLYNVAGQRVYRQAGLRLSAGSYSLILPTGRLSAGAYLVRVRAGNATQELKLIRQ